MSNPFSDPELTSILRERGWLRSLAAALVGAGEAEDLVQDTLVVALERGAPDHGNLRGFLSRIARNLAANRNRARAHRSARERSVALPERTEVDASTRAEAIELENRVAAELLKLPDSVRDTLILRYNAGWSNAEIARKQGAPEGTVRRRLKTGLDALRERLDRDAGGRAHWSGVWLACLGAEGTPTVPVLRPLWFLALMKVPLWIGASALLVLFGVLAWNRSSIDEATSADVAEPGRLGGGAALALDETARSEASARRTIADPARAFETLSFDVADSAGRPIELRGGLLLLSNGDTAQLRLDGSRAFVEPAPNAGGAILILGRTGAWPTQFEVETSPGDRPLVWPGNATCRVQLRSKTRPHELELDLELVRDIGWAGRLDPAQAELVEASVSRVVRSGADGSLLLEGLPEDWRGWIQLPEGWVLGSGERSSSTLVAGRQTPTTLWVERAPHLVGLVRDATNGQPLADSRLSIEVRDADRLRVREARTDDRGRFAWPVPDGATWLRVQAGADLPWIPEARTIPEPPGAGDLDLGTFDLEPAPRALVRVTDLFGEPIEGARLSVLGLGFDRSTTTDARGVAELGLATDGSTSLVVDAEGYATTERTFDAAVAATGQTEIRLEPEVRASVTVVDEGGLSVAHALVEWDLELPRTGPGFRWDRYQPRTAAGRLAGLGENGERGILLMTQADERGRIEIGGLPPGLEGRCFLAEHARSPELGLVVDPGPDRPFDGVLVRPGQSSFVLEGRVVSDRGIPLAGVGVRFQDMGGAILGPKEQVTDLAGNYHAFVPPDEVGYLVEFRARGFASEAFALKPPYPDLERRDVVLRPDRVVRFTLVRPDGSELPPHSIQVQERLEAGGSRTLHQLSRSGSSPFQLGEFGDGPLVLWVSDGGVRHVFEVAAGESDVHLEVPPPATIVVHLDQLPGDADSDRRYTLLRAESRELLRFGRLVPLAEAPNRVELPCPSVPLELSITVDGETVLEPMELSPGWGERVDVPR